MARSAINEVFKSHGITPVMGFAEIGKALGITKQGAKLAFDKALQKLRKGLREVAMDYGIEVDDAEQEATPKESDAAEAEPAPAVESPKPEPAKPVANTIGGPPTTPEEQKRFEEINQFAMPRTGQEHNRVVGTYNRIDIFLMAIAAGCSKNEALEKVQAVRNTLDNWSKTYPAFDMLYDQARAYRDNHGGIKSGGFDDDRRKYEPPEEATEEKTGAIGGTRGLTGAVRSAIKKCERETFDAGDLAPLVEWPGATNLTPGRVQSVLYQLEIRGEIEMVGPSDGCNTVYIRKREKAVEGLKKAEIVVEGSPDAVMDTLKRIGGPSQETLDEAVANEVYQHILGVKERIEKEFSREMEFAKQGYEAAIENAKFNFAHEKRVVEARRKAMLEVLEWMDDTSIKAGAAE